MEKLDTGNESRLQASKTELQYSKKISDREKMNPRHKIFLDWCFDNGLKWTGIDFPAYFGNNGELRGVVATRDIKPYETVLAVPNKLLITTQKAREDKYLCKVLKAHEDVFHGNDDHGDYNTLIVYLIREKLKGEDSFYYPFINLVPEIESGLVWDKETIDFIEDKSLKQEAIEAQEDFAEEWLVMKPILE